MAHKNTLFRLFESSASFLGLSLACLGVAIALLVLLRALPYSSVYLASVEAGEATARPTPDFALGTVSWPVETLAADPALQPFRQAMRASCGDAKGLAAAACVTAVLAERTPVGEPPDEYVSVAFDPVAHFERHMAGAPGHCLTRSAILATELLSVGIPARVVQLLPAQGKGHTVTEVWDDIRGWTMVDPSTGGYLSAGGRGSGAELLADPSRLEWTAFGEASSAESDARRRYFQDLLTGNLLYPEPWLYLRRGERVAPWPYRGQYARVGPEILTLGPAQQALAVAIPASFALGLGLLAFGIRGRHATATVAAASRVRDVESLAALDVMPRT
jgi:hypothetical protein